MNFYSNSRSKRIKPGFSPTFALLKKHTNIQWVMATGTTDILHNSIPLGRDSMAKRHYLNGVTFLYCTPRKVCRWRHLMIR